MPGMGTGLNDDNPVIVQAFHTTLLHQALIVLGIGLVVGVAWHLLRWVPPGQAATVEVPTRRATFPEPAARRLLRISFGLLWIFDGILQAQPSMPLGMAPQVIKPAAAASPIWVQHLDNAMATIWSYHPIAAPASAVWIQIGIGLWLLAAHRGSWSRLGGLASAGWGLIVWVFGEAFGQIFAPGLTWLFGAPGAVLLYCVAGALIALPERRWTTPRLGRLILRATGLFFLGMAFLQAWPGRGFWQGLPHAHGRAGTLTQMVQQMAQTPQPHFLSLWVAAFGAFDAAHGWATNLFAVAVLGVIGACFLTARRRVIRLGVAAGVVLCVADWVLVEDLGFMGGVGTDPNSMIPMSVLLVAGYLAITRVPVVHPVAHPLPAAPEGASVWQRLGARPAYAFRCLAALGALGITLVGAAPMALASTNPNADPILAKAVNDVPQATNAPAPHVQLIDQFGHRVSLTSFRGKTIAVTFLDDVCTSACPIIAQEFRIADGLLGGAARHVELVAINGNPRFIAPDYLRAFDRQEGLTEMANWRYLTGSSVSQLQLAWQAFGVVDQVLPAGAMIEHSQFTDVIDPSGRIRYLLNTDPGPGSAATKSSFSVTLANTIKKVVASP